MGKQIACPNDCAVTFMNLTPEEKLLGTRNSPTKIINPKNGKPSNVGVPHGITGDFHGLTLNSQELNQMIELSCDEVVFENPKFGPTFSGKPNYDFFIAKCPKDCSIDGSAPVYGIGIHP